MAQAVPSQRVRGQRQPLIITVPRGTLRRSLRELIPGNNPRVAFIINGTDIKPYTPSSASGYDLSRIQHIRAPFAGFRDLRTPSPGYMYPYEFPAPGRSGILWFAPVCPPEHGRQYPTPLSPRYPHNPVIKEAPRDIRVDPSKLLPMNRKFMSKLARRRGVEINPRTGEIRIARRRTHADIS